MRGAEDECISKLSCQKLIEMPTKFMGVFTDIKPSNRIVDKMPPSFWAYQS